MAWKRIYEGDSLEEAAMATVAYAKKFIEDKYGSALPNQDLAGASLQQDSSGQVIASSKEDKE